MSTASPAFRPPEGTPIEGLSLAPMILDFETYAMETSITTIDFDTAKRIVKDQTFREQITREARAWIEDYNTTAGRPRLPEDVDTYLAAEENPENGRQNIFYMNQSIYWHFLRGCRIMLGLLSFLLVLG